jgi:hypothetical protein
MISWPKKMAGFIVFKCTGSTHLDGAILCFAIINYRDPPFSPWPGYYDKGSRSLGDYKVC